MEVDSFCGIWTCPFLPASIKNVWLFENRGIKAFCSHSTTEIKTTHPTPHPPTTTLQNLPMSITHSSMEILFSCCHLPTRISLLTKCDLFTLHPPNSLCQHHQGEHRRCGGGSEKSGAEDRELHSAGRGAPHREGRHAFLCRHQTLTDTH